jgi:hypothetical protein
MRLGGEAHAQLVRDTHVINASGRAWLLQWLTRCDRALHTDALYRVHRSLTSRRAQIAGESTCTASSASPK